MKKALLPLLFVFPLSANAITWKVFGPCSDQPVFQGTYQADLSKSVGEVSKDIFDQNKIPYIGTDAGFNSINNSPTGLDAMEVISDTEMRAYGWCFAINGKTPTDMPDQIKLKTQQDTLNWFYGYSTNIKNEWKDYCSPGYWIKAKQFCGK